MESVKKFIPVFKKPTWNFDREKYSVFFDVYWLHSLLIACCSPIAMFIPAFVIKFGYNHGIFSFYFLALLLAIPWVLVPSLYLLYIAKDFKHEKMVFYIYLGILTISFVLWTVSLFQL
jgi:hypothetical protein